MGHATRGRRGPGLPATWSYRAEVEPPGAVGVLVVPGRRWRSPGRTHHGAHAHRLLTPGYLAGRVRFSNCIGKAPMSTTGFDRNRIIELLTELGRRLSAKGVAGRLYICLLYTSPSPRDRQK